MQLSCSHCHFLTLYQSLWCKEATAAKQTSGGVHQGDNRLYDVTTTRGDIVETHTQDD
ncbi:hypothetical protein JOB18_010523 [Solea senegalensis]|uniref:Uncharacterized protein n=1 Tax=Solea senegalensis TaxID=28829 RepID=A0AAV6SSB9_SOLSE|nr:hypothetical protein JOB18_010523 [Solea senegalensis]